MLLMIWIKDVSRCWEHRVKCSLVSPNESAALLFLRHFRAFFLFQIEKQVVFVNSVKYRYSLCV